MTGFFITGDMAQQDEKGYITIVGRDKDLIISGGLNVYPKEVEGLIDEIDGVLESAVIGVPHRDFGEAVVAVVVPSDSALNTGSISALLACVSPNSNSLRQSFHSRCAAPEQHGQGSKSRIAQNPLCKSVCLTANQD